MHGESNGPGGLPGRLPATGRAAAAHARRQVEELVDAVGSLVDKAIDRMLLTGERMTSAGEGRRLLTRTADAEAFADNIQRVIVLAVPVVRVLARGARFTRIPLVVVASAAVSIGLTLRTGVREVQVIGALVAHRLEQATGTPADPALVKKLAVELYLEPKRAPELGNDRLRLLRLTRRWVLRGAFGRNTSKHARRALEAAERLDAGAAHAAWSGRAGAAGGSAQ